MKKTSAIKNKTLSVWRLTFALALAAMLAPHGLIAASGGTSVVDFTLVTAMVSTDVESGGFGMPDARGKVSMTMTHRGDVNDQQLILSTANLKPNTTYGLIAFIGDDTNATSVFTFITDRKGAFTSTYVKNSQGNVLPNQRLLLPALNPMCDVRELDVVNAATNIVLQAVLSDPDQGEYLVNRSMNNTGFLPAAAGNLLIQANSQVTKFGLQASGLTRSASYVLTINGNAVQTNSANSAGKLTLAKLPTNSPDVLFIQTVALTSGTNIVLITGGLGIPCTTATLPPPTVSSTVPANAATGAAISANIAATFSEVMDSTTIGTGSFTLKQGTKAVAGSVSYAGVTAVFNPTANLKTNTLYTATITTGARDLTDNALANNFVWRFTTGATVDTTRPTVLTTIPADAATNVPINMDISVAFSEAMNPLTINTNSFTLKKGATAVAGTVSYVNGTATFAPATSLTTNTDYTAEITTGAKDLGGNALLNNFIWNFTSSTSTDTNPPTVIGTNPTNTATSVAINHTINATFSENMDPSTISTANFKMAGPETTNLAGTVAYVVSSQIATFTPATNLAPNTTYTNTITTGVKDLAGNALATNFVWIFTTGAQADTNLMSINLGTASTFAILATAAISGAGDQINGDVGLHPGSSQGIPPVEINGTIHVNDQAVIDAQSSLLAAYNQAVNRSGNAQTLQGNLGGLTKTPGLYVNSSSTGISGTGANAILTLDAQGDANAVFVFKMGSTLITDSGTSIVLSGGAQAKNVYWQVGSSATLGTTSGFEGNILAAVTITVNNGSMVNGRLFAGSAGDPTGAVTVNSSTITVAAP